MTIWHGSNIHRLVEARRGPVETSVLFDTLVIDPAFAIAQPAVTGGELAMALNMLLFADLLRRVPSGADYVDEMVTAGGGIVFDHGALRTIRFADQPTGALPGGIDAFRRLLEPLGYRIAKSYPLPALKMTGYAWCHEERPETLPQFFVSELHVERFSPAFQAAAARVFGATTDPLPASTREMLEVIAADGAVRLSEAAAELPHLVAAFDRHHPPCTVADYEVLLAESAEAAWIATEGNAFNHATDRVEDVEALAERLRAAGKPIKPKVEHSASGRVRQTALRADPVARRFRDGSGFVTRTVPGSFYEFISRDIDPATGRLDLAFDSSNAQGIFAMTKAA